jgi:hypothetical protein
MAQAAAILLRDREVLAGLMAAWGPIPKLWQEKEWGLEAGIREMAEPSAPAEAAVLQRQGVMVPAAALAVTEVQAAEHMETQIFFL